TFEILREKSNQQVQTIIMEMAQEDDATPGSTAQLVGDFYAAWINNEQVEALGLAPLTTHLQAIDTIDSHAALVEQLGQVHSSTPFDFWILPDPADATRNTVFIVQSGLGLPSRDHYLNDDERFQTIRNQY